MYQIPDIDEATRKLFEAEATEEMSGCGLPNCQNKEPHGQGRNEGHIFSWVVVR